MADKQGLAERRARQVVADDLQRLVQELAPLVERMGRLADEVDERSPVKGAAIIVDGDMERLRQRIAALGSELARE